MELKKTQFDFPHGRETYIADFGEGLVMKRPLPWFGPEKRNEWLKKQHKTKRAVDDILSLNHVIYYNIPKMIYIKDDEYQLLEERACGVPLTANVYAGLTNRQRYEIINGLAQFLVDMNESKPVNDMVLHKISDELKMKRLGNLVENKMPKWFDVGEIRYVSDLIKDLDNFEYKTRKAWSHCDLNAGNVLYDATTNKLSFIDFAEAGYNFIFRDIFSPLAIDLDICKPLYEEYFKLHDNNKYHIYNPRHPEIQKIMRYRVITGLVKRFIKAGDDLRLNPQSKETEINNLNKVAFMRDLLTKIRGIER